MKVLRPTGFFSDLSFGPAGAPELKKSLHDESAKTDTARIADYLRSGLPYSVVPLVVEDVVSDDHRIIGPLKYFTDGEWVWRSDLAHYVENYHCRIEPEFLAHMKSLDWEFPLNIDLDQLELPPELEGQELDWWDEP